jgi:hypothetical protein
MRYLLAMESTGSNFGHPAGEVKTSKGDHAMTGFEIQSVLRTIPGLHPLHSIEDISGKPAVRKRKAPKERDVVRLKALAEAVILQAVEDLWNSAHSKESVEFFEGEGFKHCADLAGMRVVERLKLIRMLRMLNPNAFRTKHSRKISQLRIA